MWLRWWRFLADEPGREAQEREERQSDIKTVKDRDGCLRGIPQQQSSVHAQGVAELCAPVLATLVCIRGEGNSGMCVMRIRI